MKRIITVIFATGLLAAFTTGCKEEYTTYSDAEYVMFADTLSTNMVVQDKEYFEVPVVATTACDYDRTFGVEIVDKGSLAIEGKHYRLKSNTLTIKAGERRTNVEVHGIYNNIDESDSLGFILKLVMPEQLKWDMYSDQTKVVMYKSCPFKIENFTRWCVVTSLFLQQYPGVENTSMQRLIFTEKHPTEENTVIMKNFLFTGYDVSIHFDPSDPANPLVTMDKDQTLSDEGAVFGQIHGDDKILVAHSPMYPSYFNSCQKYVELWFKAYVYNLGAPIIDPETGADRSTIGHFYNVIEWVTDEEAKRLQIEEGM